MVDLLHTLTDRIRILVAGGVPAFAGPAAPTSDNGILGPVVPSHQLSVAVGVGSSLFDARYGFGVGQAGGAEADGLVSRRQPRPEPVPGGREPGPVRRRGRHGHPRPPGHHQVHPWGHAAPVAHRRVHQPAAADRGAAEPARVQRRHRQSRTCTPPGPWTSWCGCGPGHPEPAWTAGGTYQVIRIIRMLVEFWDRVSLERAGAHDRPHAGHRRARSTATASPTSPTTPPIPRG